jgi:hypothetical protein
MSVWRSLGVAVIVCALAYVALWPAMLLVVVGVGWGVLALPILFFYPAVMVHRATDSIVVGAGVQILLTWFLLWFLSNLVALRLGRPVATEPVPPEPVPPEPVPPEPTAPEPDDWTLPTPEEIARVVRRDQSTGERGQPPPQ